MQTLAMTLCGTLLILSGFFGINLGGQSQGEDANTVGSPQVTRKRKSSDLEDVWEGQGLLSDASSRLEGNDSVIERTDTPK